MLITREDANLVLPTARSAQKTDAYNASEIELYSKTISA
jgi:hypothetical protein